MSIASMEKLIQPWWAVGYWEEDYVIISFSGYGHWFIEKQKIGSSLFIYEGKGLILIFKVAIFV